MALLPFVSVRLRNRFMGRRKQKAKNGAANFESHRIAIMPSLEIREQKYAPILRRASGTSRDVRRAPRKDRDKILYSQAWRRLAGVTQVISPDGEDLILHTRMTHSEKVAQVAWSIGANILGNVDDDERLKIAQLGGLDLDMIEAAALAHDIGHPPFGHLGESELDKAALSSGLADGYEGNAQSFRILMRLARWKQFETGLNLCSGTMGAVLKYPWIRGAEYFDFPSSLTGDDLLSESESRGESPNALFWKKFGAYRTEESLLQKARAWLPERFSQDGWKYTQTLEASVMDIADDITYAIHDLEDFILGGLIHLNEIEHEYQAGDRRARQSLYDSVEEDLSKKYKEYYDAAEMRLAEQWFQGIFEQIHKITSAARAEGSLEASLLEVTGEWIDNFISDIEIRSEPAWKNGPLVVLSKKSWHKIHLLKAFTMNYIVNTPSVYAQQCSAKRLLSGLVNDLMTWAEKAPESLPIELRSRYALFVRDDYESTGARGHAENIQRLVIDYIASLTDHSARTLFAKLNPSGVDQIFGLSLLR